MGLRGPSFPTVYRQFPGRMGNSQITVHSNNVGMGNPVRRGLQAGNRKARAQNIGTELPADLFIADEHPADTQFTI